MASLRKRLKSDNWVCCYATADGRRTQRSTGTTDKDEAMAICRRWENDEYALRESEEPVEGMAVSNKRALVAGLVSMVIVILGLVGYWQYDLWKNGPELFVDVPESERPETFFESSFAKRHRWVKLSPDALERLNTLGGKIRLNLFDDLQLSTEVVVRRYINGGKETSVGLLDNDPDTLMMMCHKTTQPGKLMGVLVDTLGTQYLISHEIDGKHVIVEVDQSKIPGCGGVIELEPAKTAAAKPASRVAPEAMAMERILRGTEEARARIGTGDHSHQTGATCKDCRSFASLKEKFNQVKVRINPPKSDTPTGPSAFSGQDEPVNTASHNLLNSVNFSRPIFAAIDNTRSFGLWGRGGSAIQTTGPASPGVLEHLRGGDVEIIDILFVYTDDLRAAQTGANPAEQLENLKLSITRTVELTNTIFSKCHIPLEVRTADVTLARWRAMSGGDATLAAAGGPAGAAWEEVQAPVRPVFDSAATPPAFTKDWTNGAKVGVYRPKYEMYNPSKLTPAGELGDALSWIGQNSNSLLYGDQYWGQGTFQAAGGAEQWPHNNLPNNIAWVLVPILDDSGNAGDNAASFTYSNTNTPELNTGPVEHAESSHGLTDPGGAPGNPATTLPTGVPAMSHIPVQQYHDLTGPTKGPVMVDIGADTIEWLGGADHGLATGSVVYFESWGTAPDTNASAIPIWNVYQQPAKLAVVQVQADGGGAAGGRPQPESQPGGGGSKSAPKPGGAGVPKAAGPVAARNRGRITSAQHYPGLSVGERTVHPILEGGRASYWYLDYSGDVADPEKSARAFLGAMAQQLQMKADTSDLQLLEVKHGLGTGHARFQQVLHGIPIYGGFVSVHQRPSGAIHALHTKYHHSLSVDAQASPAISMTSAKAAAYRKGGVTRPRMPGSGKLVWWPDDRGGAKLAWEVTICALKPLGDFHTVVDAQSGRVLLQENRICFATGAGNVFIPNPYQRKGGNADASLRDNPAGIDDNNSTELDGYMTNVSLPRLSTGTGTLIGTYADMVRLNNGSVPAVTLANEATRVYNYSRNDVRFEQTNIYYTIDRVGAYISSLGFSSGNTPPNGIRDANATRSCAQWDGSQNAFYSPANNSLHFGTGTIDSAEDSDVVAHEYGHAITFDQNINWGTGGEFGAMGEGFGDYLAVTTFFDDGDALYQKHHAAVVGEWFGMGFDPIFDNSPDVSKGKIKTILGGGAIGNFIDDNSSARSTDVEIRSVADFVIEPTNWQKLYLTDNNGSRVRRMDFNATFGTTVDVNSSFTILAGGGVQNPDANASAANVALQQSLGTLGAIDLNSTEGVFFVDKNATGSCRIRRIDTNGSLTTVAGGGVTSPNFIATEPGAASPMATTLNFTSIEDIAFDDLNRLYLSSTNAQRVWRMETNGSIILFGGGGVSELDGQPATSTRLGGTHTLATDSETGFFGTTRFVYLDANSTTNSMRLRRILVDDNATLRTISTVAGVVGGINPDTATTPVNAANALLTNVDGIVFDASGRLYFGDRGAQRVRRIDATVNMFGVKTYTTLSTVSGGGANDTGDGAATADAVIGPVKSIAVDATRQVYSLGSTPLGGLRIRKCFGGPPIDPPMVRRIDGNKLYTDLVTPANSPANVHGNGEIWSRALWDIRAAIVTSDGNASIADRIILQHHFGLPAGATMRTAAMAINNADISLYSGAHTNSIQTAFNNRGITVHGDYTGGTGVRLALNTDYYVGRVDATKINIYSSMGEAVKGLNKIDFNATGFNVMMVRASAGDITYGQAFRPPNPANVMPVVGTNGMDVGALRMDISGGGGQRYPNLHGAFGDFGMGVATARADLVCILTENVGGAAAGLAQKLTMRGPNPPQDLMSGTTRPDDVDFNSSQVLSNRDSIRNLSLQGQYLTGGYTFQHELGHVLGCAHGLGDVGAGSPPGTPGLHPHDGGITFSPYAYTNSNGVADEFLAVGNHFTTWGSDGFGTKYCTIMAYTNTRGSTRVPLFSSPVAFWKGEPTGLLRGMYLPPPLSSYDKPLYLDHARTISAVGHHAAFFRDSNGSGRASSRTSTRPSPPKGLPGERPNTYARGGAQAGGNTQAGGTQFAANPNNPNQINIGTAQKPGKGLGGGSSGGGTTGGGGTTNTNQNNGGNPGFPTGGGGPGLGTGGGGGGLPPGGTNTVPNLPINPAVPNDHRYSAMKWGGRWANNTFATVINGHNNGATHENAERGHPAFHGKSVWWYIEWPGPAPLKLKKLVATTKGSTFDTTLGVLYVPKGQPAAQVPLNNQYFSWNNNAPGGGGPFSTVVLAPNQAGVALTLNPGDRVYFMVDGIGGTTGKIRLDVKLKK